MERSEVVVVGGGAAGVAAAHALGRAGHTTLLLDGGRPRNGSAAVVTGLPWLAPEPPATVLQRSYDELGRLGDVVRVAAASVRRAERGEEALRIEYEESGGGVRRVESLAIVLATGVEDELPDVPGLAEQWGRRAFSCAACHGYEARGKRIAVLGAGVDALVLALHVARVAAGQPPTLIVPALGAVPPDAHSVLAAAGIDIRIASAARVVAAAHGIGIEVDDGVVPCDAIFVRSLANPRSQLAAQLGCELGKDGFVLVDGATGRTSSPWVYAVGDVARGPHAMPSSQILQAAASGASAAAAFDHDHFMAMLDLAS